MKPRNIFLILLVISFWAPAARAETTISAEVDKTTITSDEVLTYKLSIASTEKRLQSPKLPSFDGFSVVSQAQSNTVSYQKEGMKTILVFAFILLPQKAAVMTIEPAQIKVKNTTYTSKSLQITVKQGLSRTQPRLRKSIPDKRGIPPEDKSFPEDLSSSQPRYNL